MVSILISNEYFWFEQILCTMHGYWDVSNIMPQCPRLPQLRSWHTSEWSALFACCLVPYCHVYQKSTYTWQFLALLTGKSSQFFCTIEGQNNQTPINRCFYFHCQSRYLIRTGEADTPECFGFLISRPLPNQKQSWVKCLQSELLRENTQHTSRISGEVIFANEIEENPFTWATSIAKLDSWSISRKHDSEIAFFSQTDE